MRRKNAYWVLAVLVGMLALCGCGKKAEQVTIIEKNEEINVNIGKMITDVPELITNAKPKLNIYSQDITARMSEYKIFYIADAHISLCDGRDAELLNKSEARNKSFTCEGSAPQDTFDRLIKRAGRSNADLVILGGDIIDSATQASVEHVEEQLNSLGKPYIYLMGNHDFEYGEEYFSQTAYEVHLPKLDSVHGTKSYQIYEDEEVIVFAADDNNNQISDEALAAFKETVKKDKPIVLALHVPLEPQKGDKELLDRCKAEWGEDEYGKSKVTIGINGIYPNETTNEFLQLVYAPESNVALVLAGHVHFQYSGYLTDNVKQIIAGAAYEGNAVEVTLKWPER